MTLLCNGLCAAIWRNSTIKSTLLLLLYTIDLTKWEWADYAVQACVRPIKETSWCSHTTCQETLVQLPWLPVPL